MSNLKHQLVLQTPTTGEQRRGEERRRLFQQPVRQPQKQRPQGRLPHKLCRQRDHIRRKERRGKQALLQRDAKDLGLGGKQLRLWFGPARPSSGARGQAGEDRVAAELAGRPQVRLQAVVQSSSTSHKEGNSFIHQGNRIGSLKNNFQPPRSPAVHKIRSISLTDTSAALLLPPKLEEFEFSKRDSLMPVRE